MMRRRAMMDIDEYSRAKHRQFRFGCGDFLAVTNIYVQLELAVEFEVDCMSVGKLRSEQIKQIAQFVTYGVVSLRLRKQLYLRDRHCVGHFASPHVKGVF